ncbi:DMT family transporter [Desulfitobacterium metallireducens]|uniref:Membrane protein n=1 Tax=Desulfitobacterium metallireducens DSM 15288 TaxID=871968 RepID=W0EDB2_9FIRM|nr:DMT family transporter [Desulfitobacterium metallireducens]AHF07071.1 membrane protein [Desulfitobacterium metallireducens DSM 15288]
MLKSYFAILLSSLLYGGNVIAGRLIAGSIPPISLSAIRALLGLSILLPLAWPALKSAPKPTTKELFQLILISLLGVSLPYVSLIYGLADTTATNASVIFATLPAMTNLMFFIIFKSKPSKFQVLGILTSFLGLVIVFTQGDIFHLLSFRIGGGEIFLFLNVLCISLFNVVGQSFMKKFSSLVTSVYSLVFAILTLTPLALWQLNSFVWYLSWSQWLLVIYMGCFAAGFAYFLNLYGIEKIGGGQTSILNNLQHVFSISLGVLVLKESLYVYHGLGFVLVISGVVLSLMRTSTSSPKLARSKSSNPAI